MLSVATATILVVMAMAFIRASRGPTFYDRILAVNMLNTKTVLLICLLGFVMGRPDFLDIAIVYALISFISVLAVLYFSGAFKVDSDSIETQASETRSGEGKS